MENNKQMKKTDAWKREEKKDVATTSNSMRREGKYHSICANILALQSCRQKQRSMALSNLA